MSVRIFEWMLLIGAISGILLVSNFQNSESVLWDLIITVELEKSKILQDEVPVVIGKVVDHGNKPVQNATVSIRMGQESIIVESNSEGEFTHEFKEIQRVPGTYVINVIATSGDLIGLKSTNFKVLGEISTTSSQQELITPKAIFYLNSELEDFIYPSAIL